MSRGHVIRIAQKGRAAFDPAATLDEVVAGVGAYWVEIDGHRFDHVVSVEFRADDELTIPEVTLRLFGRVEVVYLGADGEELGAAPFPGHDGPIDYQTVIDRTPDEETRDATPAD